MLAGRVGKMRVVEQQDPGTKKDIAASDGERRKNAEEDKGVRRGETEAGNPKSG